MDSHNKHAMDSACDVVILTHVLTFHPLYTGSRPDWIELNLGVHKGGRLSVTAMPSWLKQLLAGGRSRPSASAARSETCNNLSSGWRPFHPLLLCSGLATCAQRCCLWRNVKRKLYVGTKRPRDEKGTKRCSDCWSYGLALLHEQSSSSLHLGLPIARP